MSVLITGSDGSLGTELLKTFNKIKYNHVNVTGIKNENMRIKWVIEDQIDAALESGPILCVVNNYGYNHLSWIGETSHDDTRIILDNVMSPYWVINHLVKRKQVCRVVNVASATYRVPQRCTSLYCASKAAIVQMTRVMARELAPKGWVINAIAPGLIHDTRMAKKTIEQVLELRGWSVESADEYALSLVPMGRPTNVAEVAEAIEQIFDLPSYINGSVIDMMGGV